MSRRSTTVLGIAVGLVLFFAINILSSSLLRSWRLDMTEEKLFTLSEGSRNIARGVGEPIRLKLYASRAAIDQFPLLKTYAQRVEEMLVEYELTAGGALELEVIDPEPYSEAESEAVEAGLYPLRMGTGVDKIYFGLVATNSVGDTQIIEFFDPTQERFLEYEVSRLIHTLQHPERQIVGVLSSLELAGGGFNPMMPQAQGSERWRILDYVDSVFESRMLEDGIQEIPAEVDVLLLVHPKGLSDATRYAIDQHVLRGGKAIVCVDAWCDSDPSGQDPGNPFGGMGGDKGSELPDLLAAWGVELVPGRVAADRDNALTAYTNSRGGGQEPWRMVVWLGLSEECFDQDDAVTSQLSQVNLATAGILRKTADATTEFRTLMQTSEQSMDIDVGAVQFQANPRDLLASFVPRMERYAVGARVTGPAKTAFPDGRPSPPTDGETAEPPPAAEHVAEGEIHVIVISDADFLHERFWLQNSIFGFQKIADNGDLLVNAIENLAGGEDLIAIRGRGEFARPFDRVEEIRRNAEERYLSEERTLQQKLRDAETRISELLQKEETGSTVILTPEIEAEVDKAREEMAETNRALRDVHYNLSKDIERMGTRLMWLNIGLLPAVVCATAVGLSIAGRRRRQPG